MTATSTFFQAKPMLLVPAEPVAATETACGATIDDILGKSIAVETQSVVPVVYCFRRKQYLKCLASVAIVDLSVL